jgi:tetratricopeptide (TPR) repeat protein
MQSASGNRDRFVGRVREQREFRGSVRAAVGGAGGAPRPHIFLLHGEDGMGKSALLRQFVDIARKLGVPADRLIQIDLSNRHFPDSDDLVQALVDAIEPQLPGFDTRYQAALTSRAAVAPIHEGAQRKWARWRALQAMDPAEVNQLLQRNYTAQQDKVIRETIFGAGYTPTHIAVEAERVIDDLSQLLEFRAQHRRDPDSFEQFFDAITQPGSAALFHPNALGLALAADLDAQAQSQPLVLAIDGYDRADQHDEWIRTTILAKDSNRMLVALAGRNRLDADYRRTFPETGRWRSYDLDQPLESRYIRKYFAQPAFQPAMTNELLAEIESFSRGVPLALVALGDQLAADDDIAPYRIGDSTGSGCREVVGAITRRFLRHVLDEKGGDPRLRQRRLRDRQRIRSLALLLRPDQELACALWGVPLAEGSQIMQDLASRYSFVFTGRSSGALHDLVRDFIRQDMRTAALHSLERQALAIGLRRAVEVVQARIDRIVGGLRSPGARYDLPAWREATLDQINLRLWMGEQDEARRLLLASWIKARYEDSSFADWLLARAAELVPRQGDWRRLVQILQTEDYDLIEPFAGLLDTPTQAVLSFLRARRLRVETIGDAAVKNVDQHIALLEQGRKLDANWPPLKDALIEALSARGYYRLYRQNNAAGALDDFNALLALRPGDPAVLSRRGAAHHNQGNFEGALDDFNAALNSRPNDAATLFSRGLTYLQLRNVDEALDDFDAALNLRPNDAVALSYRGTTKHLLVTHPSSLHPNVTLDDALRDLDDSLGLRPRHPETLVARGLVLVDQCKLDEAQSSVDDANTARPNDPEILGQRGMILHLKHQQALALQDLNKSLGLRPDHAPTLRWRGYARYALDDFTGALADFSQAGRVQPDDPETLNALGLVKQRIAETMATPHNVNWMLGDAFSDLTQSLLLRPGQHDALNLRCAVRIAYDDRPGAWSDVEQILAARPDDPDGLNHQGTLKLKDGDLKGAQADFRRALRLRRTNPDPETLTNLAIVLSARGKLRSARSLLNQALQQRAAQAVKLHSDARTLYYLGRLKFTENQFDDALADFDRSLKLSPHQPAAYFYRGLVKRAQVKLAEAQRDFDTSLRLRPNHPAALYQRARTKFDQRAWIAGIQDLWESGAQRAGNWAGDWAVDWQRMRNAVQQVRARIGI